MDELGFDPIITNLRENYLSLISELCFPEWGGGKLDSHKAFIVKYKIGQDIELGYHFDNAEVNRNSIIVFLKFS